MDTGHQTPCELFTGSALHHLLGLMSHWPCRGCRNAQAPPLTWLASRALGLAGQAPRQASPNSASCSRQETTVRSKASEADLPRGVVLGEPQRLVRRSCCLRVGLWVCPFP